VAGRGAPGDSRTRLSPQAIRENREKLLERNAVFRRHGYDPSLDTALLLDLAGPLRGRTLELGTGKGRLLAALLAQGARVTTIDIDPDEQRFARLNVAYERPLGCVRFRIADASALPWPDRTFDNVVSVDALHHMQDPARAVEEALRVVKPGGKIVLADFNARGFAILSRIHRAEGRRHERIRYRFRDLAKPFSARGWKAELHSGGCHDILIARREHSGE